MTCDSRKRKKAPCATSHNLARHIMEQVHHHMFLLLGEGCGPSPSAWLLAFAVAAIGELVAKPAGAAGITLVPAHRDLVLGTPTRVLFVRRSGALVVRLRRGVLAGPIAAG